MKTKKRNRKGKNNSNYIDGRCLKKHYCKDCGKKISLQTAIYGKGKCNSCSHIIHGEYLKVHYCIDCNKEIGNRATRCRKCADKLHSERMSTKLNYFAGKHFTKEKNPNWQYGLSFEEYGAEFDNALKEQVRQRDHYKCRICGCSQVENERQLDVHHIDYDKKNNDMNNLLTLCVHCHRKTNHNRDYWFAYCRYIISYLKRNKLI